MYVGIAKNPVAVVGLTQFPTAREAGRFFLFVCFFARCFKVILRYFH